MIFPNFYVTFLFFLLLGTVYSTMYSQGIAQIRMLCQIATELERADAEHCGCRGQCGGKGTEYVMLKMRRKCEVGGFYWVKVVGCSFLPFSYHQLVIAELLKVDQSVERCRIVPRRLSLLPVLS